MSPLQDRCSDNELYEIFKACTAHRGAIHNLNLVSQRFHILTQPLLYKNVNISFHDNGYFEPHHTFASGYVYDTDEPVLRQHVFLQTLTDRPAYGHFVRSFKWTLSWTSKDVHKWPSDLQDIELTTWNVLRSLTKVRTVDFGCVEDCDHGDYTRQYPASLFPAARSIRLCGNMYFGLAAAIMHSVDPATLESITLDDLQDVGQYPNGLPIAGEHGLDLSLIKEISNPDGSRGLVFPGPMRGILRPLQGRCLNLKYLYIRKCGQKLIEPDSWNSPRTWSNKADEEVYMECASFLNSVKLSLQSFHFEQGDEAPSPGKVVLLQFIRPMDDRFRRFILPVILSGNWAKLERLEIRGVGKWRGIPTISEEIIAQVKDAVGLHTKVVVADEAKSLWKSYGLGTDFSAVRHFGSA
ncbi:hypothetical protein MMC27_004988 [Xylographa pallens]|nr:hypothetical protein [Xylographa pallens]